MKNFFLISFLICSTVSFSQISSGGQPYSFGKNLTNNIPLYITETVNVQKLQQEDVVTDLHKDIPWRFGNEIKADLSLNNSGIWTILPNGDRLWRLQIESPNAKTINLNYSNFYLPNGASFFVYNGKNVLGAFTEANNKTTGEFSTFLTIGSKVTLEYLEPHSEIGNGIINVSGIVHGYRDLFNKVKTFGSSGSCNVNAICDTTLWDAESRSVVMLLHSNNSRFCSGVLVNNVPQDGTPFVLTANHCNPSSNDIFMFNYQSPDCSSNTDGPTNYTISGCTVRAENSPSDFSLVELSSAPPANYNVFYAGWSNIDTAALNATGIHHPAGDVKKISHDNDLLVESGYYADPNINHWKVIDWNSGTTEGGSSGSALFDQNHRIVGQLHGGDAACGNNKFDFYGKFSYSWSTSSDTTKQLKHWLDPQGTGVSDIDGYDPNGSNYTTDAAVLGLLNIPNFVCGDSINPAITIKNGGSNNLTSLSIYYQLDATTPILYSWTGNLPPYGVETINLPGLNLANGAHTFNAYCTNPNATTDDFLLNDSASVNFSANINPHFVTLTLKTDNYGAETSWEITEDLSTNLIASAGGYPSITGGQTYTHNLCLYNECFTLSLYDTWGDGYTPSGSLLLTDDVTGDTLAIDNTFNTDTINFPFCLGVTSINDPSAFDDFRIYPNPNNGTFNIELSTLNSEAELQIHDIIGKLIYTKNMDKPQHLVELKGIKKGLYIVSIKTEKKTQVKRIIVR